MAQTSCPEKTPSLPKGHFELGDEDFTAQSLLDFLSRCELDEQLDGLLKIRASALDRVALTRDI